MNRQLPVTQPTQALRVGRQVISGKVGVTPHHFRTRPAPSPARRTRAYRPVDGAGSLHLVVSLVQPLADRRRGARWVGPVQGRFGSDPRSIATCRTAGCAAISPSAEELFPRAASLRTAEISPGGDQR